MSPWFEGKLRLAERQGLLTGRSLNRVQRSALRILMLLDAKREAEKEAEGFKRMIATVAPASIPELWPSAFEEDAEPEDISTLDDEALSEVLEEAEVTYIFTDDEMTEDRAMSILASLSNKVTLSPADFDDDTGWA